MITWTGSAAIDPDRKGILFIVRVDQSTPLRRSAIATDRYNLAAIIQPSHHIHIDHIIDFGEIDRRVFCKKF